MGNYDNIQIPVQGNPISSSLFGNRVRDAIIAMDTRLSRIESIMSNYAFKAGSTTRASTTTMADDPDLRMYLEANSTYFVEFFITCAALAAADIKTAWSVPAGVTTANRRVFGPGSTAASTDADNISARMGTHNYGTVVAYNGVRDNVGLQFQIQEVAIVRTAATPGYCSIQWAQVTSNASGTQVNADSFSRATKVL